MEASDPEIGYTGTLDLLASDADENKVVVDFKTGRWHSQTHAAQVSAYMHAVGASHGYVLYLTPTRYTAYEVDYDKGWAVFVAMLTAERLIEEGELWRRCDDDAE